MQIDGERSKPGTNSVAQRLLGLVRGSWRGSWSKQLRLGLNPIVRYPRKMESPKVMRLMKKTGEEIRLNQQSSDTRRRDQDY